jgi:Ca-activated chloride channel family protein
LQYNENLMLGLANNGGGNYYYLESTRDLASVFRREFHLMSGLVARNARLDLKLGSHVGVCDVVGAEYHVDGEACEIVLGDLYGNDRREVTVELRLPPGEGQRLVVRGDVKYEVDGGRVMASNEVRSHVHYTERLAEVEKNRDWDTQAQVDVMLSTRSVDQAMKKLDEGRRDEALKEVAAARQAIQAAPAAARSSMGAAVLHSQEEKLAGYVHMLNDSTKDQAKAKKEIQYGNYRVQRNK